MKRLALPTALIAVAGALTACGGAAGAPSDASTEEFCQPYVDLITDIDLKAPEKDMVKKAKAMGEDLQDVGTPENISDEARDGFELTLKLIDDLPDDADQKDLEELDKDLSDEEQKSIEAFDEYTQKECSDIMQKEMDKKMGDMMGDLESQN